MTQLAKNSVGSKQIKPRVVKASDLGSNAVASANVANGSLRREDFAASQLPAGERGPQGNQGVPGADASNLFAFVSDNGKNEPAKFQYGDGATGVADPPGDNDIVAPYVVSFNRNLSGCVGIAQTGIGQPAEPGFSAGIGTTFVVINGSTARLFNVSGTNALDNSFMLSVFC